MVILFFLLLMHIGILFPSLDDIVVIPSSNEIPTQREPAREICQSLSPDKQNEILTLMPCWEPLMKHFSKSIPNKVELKSLNVKNVLDCALSRNGQYLVIYTYPRSFEIHDLLVNALIQSGAQKPDGLIFKNLAFGPDQRLVYLFFSNESPHNYNNPDFEKYGTETVGLRPVVCQNARSPISMSLDARYYAFINSNDEIIIQSISREFPLGKIFLGDMVIERLYFVVKSDPQDLYHLVVEGKKIVKQRFMRNVTVPERREYRGSEKKLVWRVLQDTEKREPKFSYYVEQTKERWSSITTVAAYRRFGAQFWNNFKKSLMVSDFILLLLALEQKDAKGKGFSPEHFSLRDKCFLDRYEENKHRLEENPTLAWVIHCHFAPKS